MNTVKKSFRLLSALILFGLSAFVISCTEEESLNLVDQQSVSSEASSDSYFEEAEDLSSVVSFANNSDFGRVADLGDDRLVCATITLSPNATETAGTITVDFGTGCTRGQVTRKGKIIITYEGARRSVGSIHTVTFDNFYVNGSKIEGTRTVSVSAVTNTSITHYITLEDGKITFEDGKFATREASHYRVWNRNQALNFSDDEISILADGTASGTNRNGVEYTMQITEDIVFKASCALERKFMPASGEKILVVGGNNGRQITVNYGTGECDNVITVTINGETKSVTVNRG